jgi:hypothetical protein
VALEVRYLDDGKGAAYNASGVLTGDELIAANDGVMSRAVAEKSLLYAFFDCNSITGVSISDIQLRSVADRDVAAAKRMHNLMVVAIYAKDDVPFALARMWMVYVEAAGWKTNVFRHKSEATAWLKDQVLAAFGVHAAVGQLGE